MGSSLSTSTKDHNLGNLYRDQGKLDKAEQMYIRALVGRETELGVDHTSTLDTVNNLGAIYCQRGKLDEAEQMYIRALAGREKALGTDHIATLDTVNNLGILYCTQGKLDKSEQVFMQVLAGREKALGADHSSTIDTFNNLGNLYYAQGKVDKAEQMYIRALAGKEKALGVDHPATLDTVHNLGNLYRDQGKPDKAEQMYMRALAGTSKSLGADHPSTVETLTNLTNLYYTQGRLDKATSCSRNGQYLAEMAQQPDVPNSGSLLTGSGSIRVRAALPPDQIGKVLAQPASSLPEGPGNLIHIQLPVLCLVCYNLDAYQAPPSKEWDQSWPRAEYNISDKTPARVISVDKSQELLEAARGGCFYCTMIASALGGVQPGWDTESTCLEIFLAAGNPVVVRLEFGRRHRTPMGREQLLDFGVGHMAGHLIISIGDTQKRSCIEVEIYRPAIPDSQLTIGRMSPNLQAAIK